MPKSTGPAAALSIAYARANNHRNRPRAVRWPTRFTRSRGTQSAAARQALRATLRYQLGATHDIDAHFGDFATQLFRQRLQPGKPGSHHHSQQLPRAFS